VSGGANGAIIKEIKASDFSQFQVQQSDSSTLAFEGATIDQVAIVEINKSAKMHMSINHERWATALR
jgi:hypothetical protein